VRFREWLQEWWATTTNLRRTTAVRDETYLRLYVLPRFGDLSLAAIGQRDVRAWVADLTSRELAPATVVKAYHLLGKVLAGAVDAGMIAQSPCRRVSLPKIEREEMRFLTPVEIARLVDAIQPRYRALVLVGAYGGLRIGELAGLRRERVDLLRGTVEVAEIVTEVEGKLQIGPPGTRASRRTIGRPRAVVNVLAEHLAPGGQPADFVFTGPEGGPLRIANFRNRIWRPAITAAGDHSGRPGRTAHPRPSPYRGGSVDCGRGEPQGGRGAGGAFLGQLHTGPLRPPVPGIRRQLARPVGCLLQDRSRSGRRRRGRPTGEGIAAPARLTREVSV
jgi:integrase